MISIQNSTHIFPKLLNMVSDMLDSAFKFLIVICCLIGLGIGILIGVVSSPYILAFFK